MILEDWWSLGLPKPHKYTQCNCWDREAHCRECSLRQALCIKINSLQEMFVKGRISKEQLLIGCELGIGPVVIPSRRTSTRNKKPKHGKDYN